MSEVIDRASMWVLLVNPESLMSVFSSQCYINSHTNRFTRNRVIVSRARSGQGRCVFARRSEPLTARTRDRASGYE